MRIGEQLHREINARARALALLVEGRVIHGIMDPFWPNAATVREFQRCHGESALRLLRNRLAR